MNNKKKWGVFIVLVLVLVGLFLFNSANNNMSGTITTTTEDQTKVTDTTVKPIKEDTQAVSTVKKTTTGTKATTTTQTTNSVNVPDVKPTATHSVDDYSHYEKITNGSSSYYRVYEKSGASYDVGEFTPPTKSKSTPKPISTGSTNCEVTWRNDCK